MTEFKMVTKKESIVENLLAVTYVHLVLMEFKMVMKKGLIAEELVDVRYVVGISWMNDEITTKIRTSVKIFVCLYWYLNINILDLDPLYNDLPNDSPAVYDYEDGEANGKQM